MAGTIAASLSRLAAASLFLSLAGTAQAAEPYGTWRRPSTGTQVSFYPCGARLCAKVAAVKDESRKKEVGTVILKGAEKSGDNVWKGDLLDLESGKTYSGVVTLESASALSLKGCVALVLCRGETWQRVK
ncbi:MAG: DUF2147 domain-containing protein [Pseudolabrys sp.]|jgi:uncharacterized protein (DUF2147 family)